MVPLPPYYFEVVVIDGVISLIVVVMNRWGVLQMLFISFTKGPGGFPYVLIITAKVPTLIPIDGITLVDHRVFVLGEDQEVFDGAATFEVSLDAITSTDLFDTFTKTLCVMYDNMALTLNFSSGSRGTCGTLVIRPIISLIWKAYWTFSPPCPKPIWGIYIGWELFLRCSFSILSNSGLLHTVLTLWERVFIILNLAERLWWISHCRYWSVWVGSCRQ